MNEGCYDAKWDAKVKILLIFSGTKCGAVTTSSIIVLAALLGKLGDQRPPACTDCEFAHEIELNAWRTHKFVPNV